MEGARELPAEAQAMERALTAFDWTEGTKKAADCFVAEHSLKRLGMRPVLVGGRAVLTMRVRRFGRLDHELVRVWVGHLFLFDR